MTCTICGEPSPADRETGYDADGICPGCEATGWREDGHGEFVCDADDLCPECGDEPIAPGAARCARCEEEAAREAAFLDGLRDFDQAAASADEAYDLYHEEA